MTSAGTPGKTILLLGSGGREHALAWKMAQSPQVKRIVVCPGSDGIACLDKVVCRDSGDALALADEFRPDLVVVGPEQPLAEGVTDRLEARGFLVFGPSQQAAMLETSKIFAKTFMVETGIPTAPFVVCDDLADARKVLAEWPVGQDGVVVKADGLAAGKGVVVTHDRDLAVGTVCDFMANPDSKVKSARILIERKISGREVSAFAICDGERFMTVGYVCDYKRVRDGDQGPNTGGMGGYSPQNWPSERARAFVEERIFARVVSGMKARGTPFKGVLFAGLMIDGDDVRVIEFNTRFGDPETQILMPLIEDDIVPLFESAAKGCLERGGALRLKPGAAVHVVMVSGGYPDSTGGRLELGRVIDLPEPSVFSNDNALLFMAGTRRSEDGWINTGGRVLGITALASDIESARNRVYAAVGRVHFDGAHWRKDIGNI